MVNMKEPQSYLIFELGIRSRLDSLPLIDALTATTAKLYRFDDTDISQICTSVIEACSNAVQHGNKLDPSKIVSVRCYDRGDMLEFEIADECGDEFDYQSKRGVLQDKSHILDTRGRGIAIMYEFLDKVEYSWPNGKGTKVNLGIYKPCCDNATSSQA